VATISTQLVRGTFLRTADLRFRPANIRVAAHRSTTLRRSAPRYAGLRRSFLRSLSKTPLTGPFHISCRGVLGSITDLDDPIRFVAHGVADRDSHRTARGVLAAIAEGADSGPHRSRRRVDR